MSAMLIFATVGAASERKALAPVPPPRPAPSSPDQARPAVMGTPAGAPTSKAVRLRAGLIEDDPDEPDFPIISTGHVMWLLGTGDAPQRVSGEIEIQRRGQRITAGLTITATMPGGRAVVSGELSGLAGAELSDMPTARRSGATEGEPLVGRILSSGAARFEVELSDDPRDGINNWRRLTQPAWLDLRFRLADGRSVVMTLEKARAGNELLSKIAPVFP